MENETEEWKRTYKNIEKHKQPGEGLFFALSAMLNFGKLCAHLAYR